MMLEFAAVILAGGSGTRLLPFTEDLPKSLLPVANRPIIAYQLEFLEHSGFTEVIVVATKGPHGTKIKSYITETYRGKLRIDLEFVSEDVEETADALRQIRHKIKKDFVVLSGDLVTDVPMHHLLDVHRVNDAALTVLLKQLPPRSAEKGKPSKEEVGLQDFVALDESRSRLLLMASASDLDEEGMLSVRRSLVRRQQSVCLSAGWQDAHLYVFAHWVLDLLDHPAAKRLSSLKSELVPYLVKRQFNSHFPVPVPGSAQEAAAAASHWAGAGGPARRGELYRCHAVLLPAEGAGFTARANTLPAYYDMNLQISRGVHSQQPEEPAANGRFVHPSAQVDARATVGAECVLGLGSRVAERTNVKRSVIGKHCTIGAGVKIANSVLMDHVVVADGASLEKCVVGSSVEIKAAARLDDCLVGFQYAVPQNSKFKGETLMKDRD